MSCGETAITSPELHWPGHQKVKEDRAGHERPGGGGERERKEIGWQSWGPATASAQDRDGWRAFLNGLSCPARQDEEWDEMKYLTNRAISYPHMSEDPEPNSARGLDKNKRSFLLYLNTCRNIHHFVSNIHWCLTKVNTHYRNVLVFAILKNTGGMFVWVFLHFFPCIYCFCFLLFWFYLTSFRHPRCYVSEVPFSREMQKKVII